MTGIDKQWIAEHGPMIVLAGAVFVQWIALQALLIHYHLFRKSLKQPRPDGVRMDLIEKTVSIHNENMDMLFKKLAEVRREISLAQAQPVRTAKVESPSIETSFVTLGEMNLKRRLQEMKAEDILPQ